MAWIKPDAERVQGSIIFIPKNVILTIYTDFHTSISKVGLLMRIQTEIPKSTFAQTRQKFCSLSSPMWVGSPGQVGCCAPQGHTGTQAPSTLCPTGLRSILTWKVDASSLEPHLHSCTWRGRKKVGRQEMSFLRKWPTSLTNSKDLKEKLVSWGKFKVFYYKYEEWEIGYCGDS